MCVVADSLWEPTTRLRSHRFNADADPASHRHYIDEEAADPLPLFPDPL
jgi:hypothetical protein